MVVHYDMIRVYDKDERVHFWRSYSVFFFMCWKGNKTAFVKRKIQDF